MKKVHLFTCLSIFFCTSCLPFASLNSTTQIKANDAFILGDNIHEKFTAKVTNTSKFELTLWQYPIDGGRHSPVNLKASSEVKVKVNENTALRIENKANEEVTVKLKVYGDTGLSMGYKK